MDDEWDPAPPTDGQRLAAGIFLVFFGLALANWYFDWKVFGGYDGKAVVVLVLLGSIMMTYFMPSARRR